MVKRLLPVVLALTLGLSAVAEASDFDRGFGQDGLIRDQFRTESGGEPRPSFAPSVSVDRGERVIVAGTIVESEFESPPEAGDLVVARYTATGQLDPTFDGDGMAVIDLPPRSFSHATAVDARNDGSVLVAGEGVVPGADPADDEPPQAIFVAKLTPDGQLDGSFGVDGLTMILVKDQNFVEDLEVDVDGRVLIAGWVSANGEKRPDGLVVRLMPDGGFDPGFSGSGVFVLNRHGDQKFDDVELAGGNQPILAGQQWPASQKVRRRASLILMHLRANGKRKKRFANRGIKIDRSRRFPGPAFATTVGRRKIVAAFGGKQIFMRAFDKRGKRVRKFGNRGRVHQGTRNPVLAAGLEKKRKRIFFGAGSLRTGDGPVQRERFLVARFKRSGSRDRAYSRNGRAVEGARQAGGNDHWVTAMDVDDVGRAILSGNDLWISDEGEWKYVAYTVARLRAW